MACRCGGRSQLANVAGVSLAAVYKTLDRLEGKGLVRSHIGEPTAERGGRGTRVYRATPAGMRCCAPRSPPWPG